MLKRMTIIGVILTFRAMAQEGLREVSWGEGAAPESQTPLREGWYDKSWKRMVSIEEKGGT